MNLRFKWAKTMETNRIPEDSVKVEDRKFLIQYSSS